MNDHHPNLEQLRAENEKLKCKLASSVQECQELREALKTTKQDLRLKEMILDQLPATVYVKDRNLRHTFVNLGDLIIKNATLREEVIGKTDYAFFSPEQAAEFQKDEHKIIETGQPLVDKEEKFYDPSGNECWLLTSKLPWRDENETIQGIIGIGQDITRSKKEQDILDDINQLILQAGSVRNVMERIVAGAMQLSKTTSGIIFMVEEAQGSYRVSDTYRYPAESEHPDPRFGQEKGITYDVITSGRPVITPDTKTDMRTHPDLISNGVCALLAMPLKQDNRVIGVFYVKDSKVHDFTYSEIDLLTSMADYAVVALGKARLLQEKDQAQKQIIALHEASSALMKCRASKDVFETMARVVLKSTEATWINIVLIDKEKAVKTLINFPSDYGFTIDMIRLQPEGNSLQIFNSGKTKIIADIEREPENVHPHSIRNGFKSVIGLPLTGENNQRIGVFWLHFSKKQQFGQLQVKSLELFARQGAMVYTNTLRLEKTEQMERFTRAVTNSMRKGKKSKTLMLIARSIQSISNCSSIALYVYDAKRDEFEFPPTLLGINQPDAALRAGTVLRNSIVYEMLAQDKPYISENVSIDPILAHRRFTQRENHQSCMIVPLIALGRRVGVIFINYQEMHSFTEDEVDRIQTLANQAAIAIPIAQLMDETQSYARAIASLSSISEDISGVSNVEDILRKIAGDLKSIIRAAHCGINLIEHKEGRLQLSKEYCMPVDHAYPSLRLDERDSITRWVIHSAELMMVEDIRSPRERLWIDPALIEAGIQSMLVVPLVSASEVIGILYLYHTEISGFNADEVTIIETLAAYAAIAIRNERRRVEQIEVIREIARTIVVENHQAPVLEGVLRSLTSLMPDLVRAEIMILDEEQKKLKSMACVSGKGFSSNLIKDIDIRTGITGWAVRNKKYRYVPDVYNVKDYLKNAEETRSELAIPMLRDREVIGVLNIERRQVDGFSESDIQLAVAITELAVVAYQNVNLYQRVVANRQLEVKSIAQIAEAIAATSQGLPETLQSVLAWIGILIAQNGRPPCLVEVLALNETKDRLDLLESWPEGGADTPDPASAGIDGVYRQVIRQKRVVMIRGTQRSKQARPRRSQSRSQLVIPIKNADKELYGLLNIEFPFALVQHEFNENSDDLWEGMAHLVFIAIEDARNYEELKKARQRISEDLEKLKRAEQRIGGQRSLMWMNHASGTWYHDVRGVASQILYLIKFASDDLAENRNDLVDKHLAQMKINLQQILDKKEMIPLNLPNEVTPLPLPIRPVLIAQFTRLANNNVLTGINFPNPVVNIDDSVRVMVSPDWLEKALELLVDNGIKAMENHPNRQIDLVARTEGQHLAISITDCGGGIAPEIVKALAAEVPPPSDPTKKKGLGMGLLIAQAIVDTFEGTLKVEKTGPKGTTMIIRLPIYDQGGKP